MELFQRLLQLVELLAENSQSRFAKSVGLSQQTFNNYLNSEGQQKIRKTLLDTILSVYPQINRNWLYFGEGEMFTSENSGAQINTPADLQRRIAELETELKEERRLNRDLTRRLLEDVNGGETKKISLSKTQEKSY